MALFGKKKEDQRCTNCRNYVLVNNAALCAKKVPAYINIRLLSQDGLRKQCPRCPASMICSDWTAR
jgi:hypothetical protein